MSIDSISLIAQNAYTKSNNQSLSDIKEAENFQDMVKVSFNRFASMSPNQIQNLISNAKMSMVNSVASAPSLGLAEAAFSELRKKLRKNEETINKSLINEASLLDLVSSTNDAKNAIQTMVVIRDKIFESFEKVMAMQL